MKKYVPVIFAVFWICLLGMQTGFAEDLASSDVTPSGASDGIKAQTDGAAEDEQAGGADTSESMAQPGETVISDQEASLSAEPASSDQPEFVPGHNIRIAPYPKDKTIRATLVTSAGKVTCELFAGAHPMTVMNFVALAKGKPSWTDAAGKEHTEPYYRDIAFGDRVKGAYAAINARPEGTNFVIPDERCSVHGPKAGAIAMLQPYPGQASTRFVLLARDEPNFKGMYAFFGACEPLDTIKALTKHASTLERIEIEE
ncbi:MAG: peptidylprolyl isomerase [Proteobacteria bacterium]|nr:peptidylprolyl isomerase [Pseudomonadota bacterium]